MSGNRFAIVSVAAMLRGTAISLFAALSLTSLAQAQSSTPPADDACARLASAQLDQVKIETAKTQPANVVVEGARRPDMTGEPRGAPVSGLPAFCRVIGSIHPEAGSNIRFEVWLPSQGWNGRYFGANNGGFAGSLRYDDLAAAVMNGGAGASTDGGHSSSDPTWARGHPERVRDYGWRSTHLTAVTAKDLANKFYGRRPDRSYFVGCSNGGRQALIEASRFPEDYDGIVAGAPAATWSGVGLTMLSVSRAQQPPGAAIRGEQASFLQSEVRKQCDRLDGVEDGVVVNPHRCNFDYAPLACGTSNSPQCFSPPQIAALRQIHTGLRDSSGRRVAFGFPPSGSEVGDRNAGWDTTLLSPRGSMMSVLLSDFTASPIATTETFDFNTHPDQFRAAIGGDLDAQPDLRRFFDRGGKLIVWHGWADSILSPEITLAFHEEILQRSGPRAKDSMRLFMIPGLQHCSGGAGADSFGQIGAAPAGATPDSNVAAAVVDWVEKKRTPESLIGRRGVLGPPGSAKPSGPPMERLHCAFPAEPQLKSGADPNSASSYTCKMAR